MSGRHVASVAKAEPPGVGPLLEYLSARPTMRAMSEHLLLVVDLFEDALGADAALGFRTASEHADFRPVLLAVAAWRDQYYPTSEGKDDGEA